MKLWPVALLALAGCAHRTALPRVHGDAEVAPHMISVAPLVGEPGGLATWEPSVLYPTLDRERQRPRDEDFTAAAGPMRATAWVWFRTYQATLSRVDGATCRFRPTCSGFGMQAVREHGLLGVGMAFGRLHRSHAGEAHYPMTDPPFLDDPVANYVFAGRSPRVDDFAAYADPSHAWYQHVRATRRLR